MKNKKWIYGLLFILSFFIGGILSFSYSINHPKKVIEIRPVDRKVIDTLKVTNTKIKYKIQYLDSIRYDTIEKVYALDDSSSVKLFYELCSK